MEGDLTWAGEHTVQYTFDVLQNCTHETYIILLTNVNPINSIKNKYKVSRACMTHNMYAILISAYLKFQLIFH